VLGGITDPGRRAAHRAGGLEAVGRTRRAGTGARLRHVADARRRAAGRARIARRVLARHAGAVALVERAGVAVGGARGTGRRARIGRAARARARAVLGGITDPGRRAAHRAGGLEAVGRTRRAGTGARLRHVADSRRRAAGRARIARRVLARHAGAVALVERAGVAVGGARGTGRRPRIGRAARARARAVLGGITDPGRRAAHRAGGLEAVGRTRRAGTGARLRHVADARRRATGGARIARRVLARHAGPVALVERAGVAVGGARGSGRRARIGRAVRARAGAVLLRIALARG